MNDYVSSREVERHFRTESAGQISFAAVDAKIGP